MLRSLVGSEMCIRDRQKMLQVYVFWSPKAEIMAKVKAEAEKLPPGTWIIGRGWNLSLIHI